PARGHQAGGLLTLGFAASVVTLLVLGGRASSSAPAADVGGTRLAFSAFNGDAEIFTISPDGSDQRQLTRNSALDYDPAFSPTGARIAFGSQRHGVDAIFTISASGTDERRVTTHNGAVADFQPAFSPDGKRIAITRLRRTGPSGIFTMRTDGSQECQLTREPGD